MYYGAETGGGTEIETQTEDDKKLEDEEATESMRQQAIKASEAVESDFDGSMLGAIIAKQQIEQQKQDAEEAEAAATAAASAPRKKKKMSKAQELLELATADTEDPEPEPEPIAAPAAIATESNSKSGKSKSKSKTAKSNSNASSTNAADTELLSSLSVGDSIVLGDALTADGGAIAVEKVERDVSTLASDEKLKILSRDAPELLPLIDELKSKLSHLKSYILPTLASVASTPLATHKAFEYLDAQRELLTSYCTYASFYLLLKAEGKPVHNHPVVKELVRYMLPTNDPACSSLSLSSVTFFCFVIVK